MPAGTIVLAMPLGNGYSLLVEGVDSDEAQGLIADMGEAGLEVEGPTDLGNGEWTALVTGAERQASYAYASGGAGLPNVSITLADAP